MAKFFNPKEEIFDIQLTSHGKHLLSKGAFIPRYYAFYDDDIIYDADYASASFGESQSEIHDRIQDQTPRIKVQSALSGVETNIKRTVELTRVKKNELGDKALQPMLDKHFALSLPLGTSALSKETTPAWDSHFVKGKLSGSVGHYHNKTLPYIKIPQLDCEILFRAKPYAPGAEIPQNLTGEEEKIAAIVSGNSSEPISGFVPSSDEDTIGVFAGLFDGFEDGSALKIYKDSIILEINEKNTDYLSHNFDIEVYEIQEVTGSSMPNQAGVNEGEELIPLYFARSGFTDFGASYLNDETNDFIDMFPETDPRYVEHYFEINVDREINPLVLCALLPDDKARRKSLQKEFDCPDRYQGSSFADQANGLYDSIVDSPPEDCD